MRFLATLAFSSLAAASLIGCSSDQSETIGSDTECPRITSDEGKKERTYRDDKLGFIMPIPGFLCEAIVAPSEQGTGIFVRNEGVSLTVMGDLVKNSDVKLTTADVQAYWNGRGGKVTYASTPENDGFSVSGIIGSDIFYERYVVKGDVYRRVLWMYPQSVKEAMDKPVASSVVNFNFGDPSKPQA